jgi:hypothetical protein
MEVYVTRHRLSKILKNFEFTEKQPIEDILKKQFFILSDRDLSYYSVLHLFLSNPEKFTREKFEKWVDTYTFVIEQSPAYHKTNQCKFLQSNFDNFYIPVKVKEVELIDNIRNIAENPIYKYHFNDKLIKEKFINECISYFLEEHKLELGVEDFKATDFDNSGYELIENDLNILSEEIKQILKEASIFFNHAENKFLLENYRNFGYNITKTEYKFDKGYIEHKIYTKLNYIRNNFYNKLKARILMYLFEKYNPEGKYDTTLLQLLEFRPCIGCLKK